MRQRLLLPIAERAAAALDAATVGVDLIDLRSIAPWDRESVVASVARTRRLVVVHEDNQSGGFGAEVAAGARPVVDDDLRAERLAEPRRNDARNEIGIAAHAIGHDEADRLLRVSVPCCRRLSMRMIEECHAHQPQNNEQGLNHQSLCDEAG